MFFSCLRAFIPTSFLAAVSSVEAMFREQAGYAEPVRAEYVRYPSRYAVCAAVRRERPGYACGAGTTVRLMTGW
jgi:hypothetical protein